MANRKETEDDVLQAEAARLLDELSDTSQAINHIIEKSAKLTKAGVESGQNTRGKRLPLDKAHTATIQFTNESHHYFLEFPPMPITSMLRIDFKRRRTQGSEVRLYVGREPVPSPSSFEWHCPCESSLLIDPEDPGFYHGTYWLTVFSLGKNAEYTLHCRSMAYREHASSNHDRTAVKLLAHNIQRRIVKSDEVRVASQKELKNPRRGSPRDDIPESNIHEKFQQFEWLQTTMEPFDMKSRAVSVSQYHFNPVRMRDAIVQIQEELGVGDESTAKKRYDNTAVDAKEVCDVFITETFKAMPRFRPQSALSQRTRSSSPASPTRSRPSVSPAPKSVAEPTNQKPSDRRIVLLQSKGQMPASYLGRLRADADDFRTHSFDRLYFKLLTSGVVQQSASEEAEEGETALEAREILAAKAVTLHDQPSTFHCFRLSLAASTLTFAAFSADDRDRWLRAAQLFVAAEKSVAPTPSRPETRSPIAGRNLGTIASPATSRASASSPLGRASRTSSSEQNTTTPLPTGSSPSGRRSGRLLSANAEIHNLMQRHVTVPPRYLDDVRADSDVDARAHQCGSPAASAGTAALRRPYSADPAAENDSAKRRPATAMQ